MAGALDADVLAPVGADATDPVNGAVGTADGLVTDTSAEGLPGTADFAVSTITGFLGLSGDGGVFASAGASASSSGLLGLTDGLL